MYHLAPESLLNGSQTCEERGVAAVRRRNGLNPVRHGTNSLNLNSHLVTILEPELGRAEAANSGRLYYWNETSQTLLYVNKNRYTSISK